MIRAFMSALALALALTGTSRASSWHCDHALTPAPNTFGFESFSFRLELRDGGAFEALRVSEDPAHPKWRWRGQWTAFDNEIAMIGTTEADAEMLFTPVADLSTTELRAFSAWVERDVMIFNMHSKEAGSRLVRCLSEKH